MGRFINLPKSKQFSYTPRYFDEKKERLEKRKKEIAQEIEEEKRILSDSNYAENIRGQMHGIYKLRKREEVKTNVRLVLIIGILVALFYFLILK